ncbi:MAG: hypothetical protein ACXWWD_11940 [Chitinophagaceae bacterium]
MSIIPDASRAMAAPMNRNMLVGKFLFFLLAGVLYSTFLGSGGMINNDGIRFRFNQFIC